MVWFLSCHYLAHGQREQIIPIQIKENRIDSCIITKEEQKTDSLYKSDLAAFKYNTEGRIVAGYHYKNIGDLSLIEKYKYDKNNNIIEIVKHDIPNTTFIVHDSTSTLSKKWLEEMRFHNRNIKYVLFYNNANNIVKKEIYNASYDTKVLLEKYNTYNCYYTYNDSGYLEKKIEVRPFGNTDENIKVDSTRFTYNEKGEIIKKIVKEYAKDVKTYHYYYNEQGKNIRMEICSGNDTIPNGFYYEYDSLMNMISYKKFDHNNVLQYNYSYKYSDTLLIEDKYRDKEELHFDDTYYTYDSLNRKKSITTITFSGFKYTRSKISLLIKKHLFENSGRLKTEKRYWKGFLFKNFRGKTDYSYNENGLISYEKEFDEKNKLSCIIVYKYNNKKQVIQAIEFDKDSVLVDTEFRYYDTTGTKYARKLIDSDGNVSLYQTYKYNEDGEEIGGVFFKNGRKEITKRYTYNSNGTYNTIRFVEKNWDVIEHEYLYRYTYY